MHYFVVFELPSGLLFHPDELLVVSVVPDCKLEVLLASIVEVNVKVQAAKQIGQDFLNKVDLDRLALDGVRLRNVNVFKVEARRRELSVVNER